MNDWEGQIGEYAQAIITLVESDDGAGVVRFISKLEPTEHAAATVAITKALLRQEVSNEALVSRNAVLEGGNIALFRERRELTDKVSELRVLLDRRAAAAPVKPRTRMEVA